MVRIRGYSPHAAGSLHHHHGRWSSGLDVEDSSELGQNSNEDSGLGGLCIGVVGHSYG